MVRCRSGRTDTLVTAERDAVLRQRAAEMFAVYILYSQKLAKYYIGSTKDIHERLKRHNFGQVKFTSRGKPWKLIYQERSLTRSEAYKREREIKSYKGGIKFKKLLGLV